MPQRHYQLSEDYDQKLIEESLRQHRTPANLAAHYVMSGLDAEPQS